MPKIIPFHDSIVVKRKRADTLKNKESKVVLPDSVKERPTDLATVVSVPDNSFADKDLIECSVEIIKEQIEKAKNGDSGALLTLIEYNKYLKNKSIRPGDEVMVNKYIGTDFYDNQGQFGLTLCKYEDVIGIVEYE